MKVFPTKSKLLLTFLSCINWEEKYLYIIDLGSLLPTFPENMRTTDFLTSGCQSRTWIVLTTSCSVDFIQPSYYCNYPIKLYGDSDSSIIKGIIAIIFSLYQGLTLQAILDLDVKPFLEQLQLQQNLTASRSQGIQAILNTIYSQAKNLKSKILRHTDI